MKRDLTEWMRVYERDQLAATTAAAAQKIAHMILDGEITDQKALIQALPYLVDITRLEEGKHTNATLHATMTGGEAMERIRAIREQAGTVTPELDAPTEPEATSTDE